MARRFRSLGNGASPAKFTSDSARLLVLWLLGRDHGELADSTVGGLADDADAGLRRQVLLGHVGGDEQFHVRLQPVVDRHFGTELGVASDELGSQDAAGGAVDPDTSTRGQVAIGGGTDQGLRRGLAESIAQTLASGVIAANARVLPGRARS